MSRVAKMISAMAAIAVGSGKRSRPVVYRHAPYAEPEAGHTPPPLRAARRAARKRRMRLRRLRGWR